MLSIALLLAALLFAPPQDDPAQGSGWVRGFVRDAEGRVLPGAAIIASGETTVRVQSRPSGDFALRVTPGRYVVHVEMAGFSPLLAGVIEFAPNDETFWSPVMQPRRDAEPLQESASILAGPDAVDCGTLAPDATTDRLQASFTCLLDAARDGRTATVVQRAAIGSQAGVGLARPAVGGVVAFSYQPAIACDASPCGDQLLPRECARPQLVPEQRGTTRFFFSCD